MADTRRRLEELKAAEPGLAARGTTLVRLIEPLTTAEYRAEEWSRRLQRPAAEIAVDLLELNQRDILGFSVWEHAWVLERKPGAEPRWTVIEDQAQQRRAEVAAKSEQAKRYARQSTGCRVRTMLGYFGAEALEVCDQCDLCADPARPWAASHISREGLVKSLPARSIVLQLLDDTRGVGYSRRNVELTLVGRMGTAENPVPSRLARHHLAGRLAFLGAPAVKALIDDLIVAGLVRAVPSELGGTSYECPEITDEGRAHLRGIE